MSKIVRKDAKLFGVNAGAGKMAEFGSLKAGTPVFTFDPNTIQSLAAWLEGWYSAVIGANSPAIEDMNAFCYVMAYQIAYLMQEGIAEWSATTTYYTGSLVNSSGQIFLSLTDNNLNNSPVNGTNWFGFYSGALTQDVSTGSVVIPTGKSLTCPYLTISVADTYTVQTAAQLIGVTSITILGNLTIQGTGISRIL